MAKVVRHATFEVHGEGPSITLRLKKWSAAKLFVIVKDFGAILEDVLEGLDSINEIAIVTRLVVTVASSQGRAIRLIKESVDDPELTDEQIMAWYPESFLGCLQKIFELNITEELGKNFRGLLGAIATKAFLSKKEEKKAASPGAEDST